jgi:hypothetical protein
VNRRVVIVALLALAAGLLAFAATSRFLSAKTDAPLANPEDRLAWLAREFHLTPGQAAAAERLQIAYAPVCEAHCAAIADAERALAEADDDSARVAARAELARLEKVCADATRAHLEAIAALMEPAQAVRFLALMEPRVNHASGRTGAPALDATP